MVSTVHPMQLLQARARAYVYAGDWVADCPRACGNVEHLYQPASRTRGAPRTVRVPSFRCSYCKLGDAESVPVDWPSEMADIMAVLMLRPIPHTRNWYPAGHETAVRCRIPHGQSVDDLRVENAEHDVPTGVV